MQPPSILLVTCGSWHLPEAAIALEKRQALAGLWTSDKNRKGIGAERYRRSWPFHLAMKPFYHGASQLLTEKMFYRFFPIWRAWLARQKWPECQAIQAIMGYASEPFDYAEKVGALKIVDCPNSHPVTYFGNWQRECDLWCSGEEVPIPRWMFARMTRELERADLILVQSLFCRDSMIANGLPAGKIFVNPMGVDTTLFRPRQAVPVTPRFICVATICVRKGHQYLFRAFERVKKAIPNAELICVGDYKSDFRKERPRWEGLFTHYPSLPQSQIVELFQNSTAFVFPSQEEGIARAQVEALAAGLPVIGTYPAGTTTLVEDGVEGFVIQPHDVQGMADAMIRLANDPKLNSEMGHAAIRRGALGNTWLDYGDRLLQECQQRLEQRA